MDPASVSQILDRIEEGDLSAGEGVKALRRPVPVRRQDMGRAWLPLWLRIVVAEKGERGIRLWIPLFIVTPLVLVIVLLLLPLVLVGLFLMQMRGRRVPWHVVSLIAPISFALIQLFLNGRGTGVEVKDHGDVVIVRLQ